MTVRGAFSRHPRPHTNARGEDTWGGLWFMRERLARRKSGCRTPQDSLGERELSITEDG